MAREEGFRAAVLLGLRHISSRLCSLDSSDGDGESLVACGLLGVLNELLLHDSRRDLHLQVVKIVGNLALRSPEMNRRVAVENELIDSLLEHVSDTDVVLSSAAINTVVDMSMTAEGRVALQEASVLDRFMFVFLWVAHFISTRPNSEAKGLREYFETALRAVELSLLQHREFKLDEVPKHLLCCAYLSLKSLWQMQHSQKEEEVVLPKFLARLGMQRLGFRYLGCTREYIMRIFLGHSEHFYKKHWEQAPALIKSALDDGFRNTFLLRDFPSLEPPKFLKSFIDGSVSSPPVTSDELDPRVILKEIQNSLGGPLRYEQDIRLVRCKHKSSGTREVHYFRKTGKLLAVSAEDCLKAFEAGYTVAIRGMEFRSPTIAAFCDSLASMLGQASIGANLYLTPANSQGLSLHYDDHCVFVVQIAGQKHWQIHPAEFQLPELYAARSTPDSSKPPLMDVLLKEGEVLYIPRGFPHQAFTGTLTTTTTRKRRRESRRSVESTAAASCCSTGSQEARGNQSRATEYPGYSMHLTFGVEVELPFTWEGFMHIAVHNYFIRRGTDEKSWETRICKLLLHFSVRASAAKTVEFRKACLVAASLNPVQPPQEIFKNLVESLACSAKYEEACESIDLDDLAWMNWFEHLPHATGSCREHLRAAMQQELEDSSLAAAFYRSKADFVSRCVLSEAAFEEACLVYKDLRLKYRDVRLKHALGLLALHHWYVEEANAPIPRDF